MTAAHENNQNKDQEEEWTEWASEGDPYAQTDADEEETKNPCKDNLDMESGAHVSHEDLKEKLLHLTRISEEPTPGMRAETQVMDRNVIASRMVQLPNR